MSDYNRIYNLTLKDSLPSGNSGKVIKGAELDAELNAVSAAIASKSDSNSPTFTGTPAAPTATYGTNTTQLATTAFVQAALQALYPVGSVYINAAVNTNPATLLGFGTWVSVGDGKVLVNQDTADTDFDVLGETGGSKSSVSSHTHTLTSAGSHNHTGTTSTNGSHTHSVEYNSFGVSSGATTALGSNALSQYFTGYDSIPNSGDHSHSFTTSTVSDHSHTVGNTGTSNGNLQPYVTVKMWKRTA